MKNFAKTVSRFLLCERLSDWAKLGLRVFIGFMMLTHGIAKIEQFDTLKSTFPATMGMSSSLSTAELPMLYLGIYTFILLAGPGRYSADAFFVKTFHLETSSESMEEV